MQVQETPAGRHHSLDLIRGLAAVSVAQFHFMKFNVGYDIQSLGTFTVYIFFVLSSLTMMLVYGRDFSNAVTRQAATAFYRRRAIRLLPLLVVVTVVALALGWRQGDHSIARPILTASGLMALHLPGLLSTVPGAWSLGIEIGFYLVFPIAALLCRSRSSLLILLLILVVAQQLLIGQVYGQPQSWALYNTPLTFAAFFVAGMLIYRLPKLDLSSWSGLILSVAAFGVMATFSLWSMQDLFTGGPAYLGLTGLAVLCVACAWATTVPATLEKTAQFLGELSYPLYLTHWLALDVAAGASRALHLPMPAQWGLFVAVALAGALAANRLIERPAARYFRERRPVLAALP